MSKNTSDIPFTEIVERASQLAAIREDVEKKVRGIVNDIYLNDIPRKEDWSFLIATSSITFTQEYTTGNATINTGGATVTFSSDVTIDSTMVGRKIKFSSNDYIYTIMSMSGNTGAVIGPTLSGTVNISAGGYSIFQPVYSLNADFDRFLKNGGLHYFSGGRKVAIPESSYQDYISDFSSDTTETQASCRVVGIDTAGNRLVEVIPPPKSAISTEYDYISRLRPLRETTAGLIANIGASGTAVTGNASTLFAEATTGDWFRIDAFGTGADSEWHQILAISGTGITLRSAFGNSGATNATYTISSHPRMPTMLHTAILYGAMIQLTASQNDPMAPGYKQEYASILSDGKRLYKTRTYSKEIKTIAEDYLYRR